MSWNTRRIEHEQAMYKRLRDEISALAGPLGQIVLSYAARTGSDQGKIPNRRTTREEIQRDVWQKVIKPYYIGAGDDPLVGPEAQSPYMRLIVDGIRGATKLQVEQQIDILKKKASATVINWLTGPRLLTAREMRVQEQGKGPRVPWYDPFHLFVNPNGYRLSDNGWNTAIEARRAIDNLLDYHIGLGTPAVEIANLLEPYLWPEAAKVLTQTPYGVDGSYWARRLARTEITAAAGRSMMNAALLNPYVEFVKWNLSLSHPEPDICDDNAHGGPDGDGTYPKTDVPQYPAHPHELCYLTSVVTRRPARINERLEQLIAQQQPEAVALRGAFNANWLLEALMTGALVATFFENDQIDWRALVALAA